MSIEINTNNDEWNEFDDETAIKLNPFQLIQIRHKEGNIPAYALIACGDKELQQGVDPAYILMFDDDEDVYSPIIISPDRFHEFEWRHTKDRITLGGEN